MKDKILASGVRLTGGNAELSKKTDTGSFNFSAAIDIPNSSRTGSLSAISSIAGIELAVKPEHDKGKYPEELYLTVPFRFLSATLIPGHLLDVPEPVLKRAVKLWDRKPVQLDHSLKITDNVGITSNPVWDTGTPPGINGNLHIDKARDESLGFAISRGLEMGTLNATSVQFYFEWKKSHPKLDEWAFWEMLGTEVEGEIVRIILTKITDVWEQSLVLYGADPNAKRLSAISGESDEAEGENDEDNDTDNEKEAVMLEKIRKMLGLPDDADEGAVLTAIKSVSEKAGKFDCELNKVRDAGLAAQKALRDAGKPVNPALSAMLEGSDENAIRYASDMFCAELAENLPDKGRSSKTTEPDDGNHEDPPSPPQKFRSLGVGGK